MSLPIILSIVGTLLMVIGFTVRTFKGMELSWISVNCPLFGLLAYIVAFFSFVILKAPDFTWILYVIGGVLVVGVVGGVMLISMGIGGILDGIKWENANREKSGREFEVTSFIKNGVSMLAIGIFMTIFWVALLIWFLSANGVI